MTKTFTPKKDQLHALLKKSIITGFYGGIIWSVIWLMAYGMNMVKINPVTFWDHFFRENLPFEKWYMYMVAIGLYSLLSISIAVMYYVLFKRFSHWLIGTLYGVLIWALLLFGFPLIFNRKFTVSDYSDSTLIGLCCLGVLYGLFIGYTISFDYKMLRFEGQQDLGDEL